MHNDWGGSVQKKAVHAVVQSLMSPKNPIKNQKAIESGGERAGSKRARKF
jgi:hypothetical protein